MMKESIKVFLFEQSIIFRSALAKQLEEDDKMEVVSLAKEIDQIENAIQATFAHVIVVDIEGFTELEVNQVEKLIADISIPFVLIIGQDSPPVNKQVLFVKKPPKLTFASLRLFSQELTDAIVSRVENKIVSIRSEPVQKNKEKVISKRVVTIGSSTGGPEALTVILKELPPDFVGVLIAQHIFDTHIDSFVEQLNLMTPLSVKRAVHHDIVYNGVVYIAPGNKHLKLMKRGDRFICYLQDKKTTDTICPSVNLLFQSAAEALGKNAIGVILTGLGDDGANGLKEIRDCGGVTIGQDSKSCVVYGMPRAAKENGAVKYDLSLKRISEFLIGLYLKF